MKIYKVTSEYQIFVVIAESEDKAKEIVIREYFAEELDDELSEIDLQVEEQRDLREGIVLHYDFEDLYWNN